MIVNAAPRLATILCLTVGVQHWLWKCLLVDDGLPLVRKLFRTVDQQSYLVKESIRIYRTRGELTLAMPIGEAASASDGGAMTSPCESMYTCLDKTSQSVFSTMTSSLVVISKLVVYIFSGDVGCLQNPNGVSMWNGTASGEVYHFFLFLKVSGNEKTSWKGSRRFQGLVLSRGRTGWPRSDYRIFGLVLVHYAKLKECAKPHINLFHILLVPLKSMGLPNRVSGRGARKTCWFWLETLCNHTYSILFLLANHYYRNHASKVSKDWSSSQRYYHYI